MSNRQPAYLLLACTALGAVAYAVASSAIVQSPTPHGAPQPHRRLPANFAALTDINPATSPTTLPANPTTGPAAGRTQAAQDGRAAGAIAAAAAASPLMAGPQPWKDPPPLPPEYSGLLSRSLFRRGGGVPLGPDGKPLMAGPMPPGPEATLAFCGAGLSDGRFTAFIEDANTKKVQRVAVGEAIASGRVVGITLDRLEYEAGGRRMAIAVGNSLAGTPLPAPPPQPPQQPAQPGQGPPGGPPNGRPPRGPRPPGMPPVPPGMVVEGAEGVAVAPEGQAPPQQPAVQDH